MPPPETARTFVAHVERADGGFRYHYLPLPPEAADAWQARGVRRLAGTLNGHPVRRAIQSNRDGERFVILGLPLLRDLGAALGEPVMAELHPDPDPDHVELGEEFAVVLEQDEEAAARFYAMTHGRQRSLASYVTSAKREETRIKRALELAHRLRTHTLYGDLHPEKR
jgi:hypothetical protein